MISYEVLAQHVVDIQKATADYPEASKRPSTSSHMKSTNERFATRSVVQRKLSIYNWNPGSRRGKEDAFEKNCRKVAYHYLAGGVRIC